MNLKILLSFVIPIFVILFTLWTLFSTHQFLVFWWAQFSAIGFLAFIAWILGNYTYDVLNFKEVKSPNGKAVVITGCDSGFGHELAIKLDKFGFHVFAGVLFPSGPGANKLTTLCSSKMTILKLDVTNPTEVQEAVNRVSGSKLHLWAVVNNAGVGASGFTDWGHDVDEYRRTFEVNTFGLVRVSKNFLPLLRETKGSRIVNVASLAGRITPPCLGHYAMSKHSVRVFSDCLRRELHLTNDQVQVVTIEPTFYKTAIIDTIDGSKNRDRLWNETPEANRVPYTEEVLNQRKRARARIDAASRTDLSEVVDTMAKAVIQLEPKLFYRCCGWFDLAIWAVAHAPEVLVDYLFRLLKF